MPQNVDTLFQSAFLKAKPYQKGFAKLALLLKISKWVAME